MAGGTLIFLFKQLASVTTKSAATNDLLPSFYLLLLTGMPMSQLLTFNRITAAMLAAGVLLSSPLHAEVEPAWPGDMPAEFRELWQPQSEMVEVNLYGRSLGLFKLNVLPDTVTFAEPEKLLGKLRPTPEQRSQLLTLLQKPMARNGNLSCQGQSSGNNNVGCNTVQTDTAAVVLDDSDSVLHLFLGKALMTRDDSDSRFWQPTEDTGNALLHSQSVNYSDSDGYQTLSVTGLGALGVTQNSYAMVDWQLNYFRDSHQNNQNDDEYDNNNNARRYQDNNSNNLTTDVNSAYYRYDIARRYYVQGGRMDNSDLSRVDGGNFNFSLMPVPRIDGARAGTTQSYLRQRENAVATPVTLLLTRFSRVEAYRGNQLLGTYYLAAGVQNLDTRALPNGSYTLDLRVFEQDKQVRSETVPFNKSNTSVGEMQWDAFIQGGKIVDKSTSSGDDDQKAPKNALESGIRVPIGTSSTVQQGISSLDGSNYYESKLDWNTGILDGSLSTSFAWLWGAEGAKGNSENISYSDGFSVSLYHVKQQAGSCETSRDLDWGGCTESYSASVSVPVLSWQTTLGYTDNRNESVYRDEGPRYDPDLDYQPSWEDQQGRSRTWQLNTSTSYLWKGVSIIPNIGVYRSQNDDDKTDRGIFLTLTLMRSDNTSTGRSRSLSAGYTMRNTNNGGTNQDLYADGQWSSDVSGNHREIETRVSGSSDSYEGMMRGRTNSRFGDLNGSFSSSHDKDEGDNRQSVSVTYDSSFALSRNGLFWGGNASGIDRLAGSTVQVESEETSAPLVTLKGGGSGSGQTLSGGQRTLVPVTALTQSDMTVDEIANGKVNVQVNNSGRSELFMLPGHVYPQIISADTSWTYVGRALDESGKPLSGATVLNTSTLQLEEDGGFSFDYPHKDPVLYLLKGQKVYACPVVVKPREDALIYLGEVKCRNVGKDVLPQQLTSQSRVSALLAQR